MNYNLEGKIFTSLSNAENGEVGEDTLFYYHQEGAVVWAEYEGGAILKGHLIAKVLEDGRLQMNYHHLNTAGEIMLGKCSSTPVLLPDGRLKFQEEWQWLSGDHSSGYSEIIEIDSV
jgi:hypothetical protein